MTTMLNKWRPALSWRGALYLAIVLACLALLGLRLGPALAVDAWSVAYARLAMRGEPIVDVLGSPPPSHRGASLWLAREALAAGQPGRALELLDAAPSERALEILRISALALEGEGRYPDAIQAWTKTDDVYLLQGAAERARKDGRSSDAVALMRAAFAIDPLNETWALANSLWDTAKDREAAIELLRSSITANPDSPMRYRWMLRLGDFLRFEQEWDEAASIYNQVIEVFPGDATAWIGLGWAMYGADADASEARAAFAMAIELAPETGDGQMALGQLMAREQVYEEADWWFERAIARRPNNPWWLLVRANNAREADDLDHAFQLYEDITSRFPEFAAGYYEEALAHERAGNRIEAIDAIEHAIELQMPPSVDYYVRAGQIYEWAGERQAATMAYLRAVELDPGNVKAREQLEALRK